MKILWERDLPAMTSVQTPQGNEPLRDIDHAMDFHADWAGARLDTR